MKKYLAYILINFSFLTIFFFFLTETVTCGSSWARDLTCAVAVTRATAVTMPDPYLFVFLFSGVFLVFFFFCSFGLFPRHMEVPRQGVKSELQLLAYTIASQNPSLVCCATTGTPVHMLFKQSNH